jgi:hypothetical protein
MSSEFALETASTLRAVDGFWKKFILGGPELPLFSIISMKVHLEKDS